MPVILFIADASTPNGQVLAKLVAELADRAKCIVGNDMASFQESPLLSEVDVIVPVVFAGGKADVIRELWPLCPKVKWVHSLAAGVETVVPLLNSLPRGPETPLTNAKGAFSRSLAEYALLAMLHFNKQLPRLQANREAKKWERFTMNELAGQTVGFVGFGDIAQATARVCKGLGMRIVALRNSRSAPASELTDAVFYSDSEADRLEVFRQSDHVICSLPGGASTAKFCGKDAFAAMKASGIFISIGRGTCVDEDALVAALTEGRIAGAALDVFAVEPLPQDSGLWSCPNMILSPHNADLTVSYINQTWGVFLEKLAVFENPDYAGFPSGSTVDKVKGY